MCLNHVETCSKVVLTKLWKDQNWFSLCIMGTENTMTNWKQGQTTFKTSAQQTLINKMHIDTVRQTLSTVKKCTNQTGFQLALTSRLPMRLLVEIWCSVAETAACRVAETGAGDQTAPFFIQTKMLIMTLFGIICFTRPMGVDRGKG